MPNLVDTKLMFPNQMQGPDNKIYLGNLEIGRAQAVSYTSQREVVTNFVLGRSTPISVAKGKVGFGGSMVLLEFHAERIRSVLAKGNGVYAWKDEAAIAKALEKYADKGPDATKTATSSDYNPDVQVTMVYDGMQVAENLKSFTTPWRMDMLPPLDMCIVNLSESGWGSRMYIIGITFVNEGGSMSIDDINMSTSYTYIATSIIDWRPIAAPNPAAIAGNTDPSPYLSWSEFSKQ